MKEKSLAEIGRNFSRCYGSVFYFVMKEKNNLEENSAMIKYNQPKM